MRYVFDLDGTLCKTERDFYEEAKSIKSRIKKVNKLFDEGHTIIIYTARGGTTGVDWTKVTKKQLKKWNLKYHELKLGKPSGDIYVDDKSSLPERFFDGNFSYSYFL
jgi:uncharacterized HAD superfamily protein